MVDRRAVALSTWVNSFTSGGIDAINVCGSITLNHSVKPPMPSDRAASNWPLDTEANPPRNISMTKARYLVLAQLFRPQLGQYLCRQLATHNKLEKSVLEVEFLG